jgi:spore coat polysaccharide biosynthesis protein SpsF
MKANEYDMATEGQSEVTRLENLWQGDFGNEYVDRNRAVAHGRGQFWREILADIQATSVLEVGCNIGANLHWISQIIPARRVYGVDINEHALRELRVSQPQVNALWSPARQLPFRDRWFDLVFTTGVLIHQPLNALPLVMSEIVRCSDRYVLCGEYHAAEITEVSYRGHSGALWKRDYGAFYQDLFPELKLLRSGFLSKDEGWDDVTYWLFEKVQH